MKKILLALSLLPLLATSQEKTTFGINAGLTFADLRGDIYVEDFSYGLSYLIGLSMEAPISDRWSFLANINYEKKSPSQTITNYQDPGNGQVPDPDDPAFLDFEFKARTALHYISVPLNFKYYIGAKKNFFATGGAYVAVLAGDTYKLDGKKTDGSTGITTLDYGLGLGFGTKFKLNETQNLNIELRDNLGIPLILDDNAIGEARINSINLIVNWQFSL
ncbi:MAG: hypothetical protein DI539_07635 [Flavobacterium psychrophilum]|nr:MAG: hypothetical protein DI539_07635 [Flavobacterium psychrophilum]